MGSPAGPSRGARLGPSRRYAITCATHGGQRDRSISNTNQPRARFACRPSLSHRPPSPPPSLLICCLSFLTTSPAMSTITTPNDSPVHVQPLHNPSQAAHVSVPQAPLGNATNGLSSQAPGMGAKALLAKKMANQYAWRASGVRPVLTLCRTATRSTYRRPTR